jgi:hypothetical protein
MSEPTPPQARPSGRNLVPAAVFLVAMVLLGAALGFAYLNAKPGAVAGPGGNGHHTLDSPYQARPFFHGQAQAESNFAVGRAFPRNLSFAYLTKGYLWLSLTDVNTVTPTQQYQTAGLVTMSGELAGYSFGRFLAYGVDHHQTVDTPQRAIDWIHANAGVAYLASPLSAPALDFKAIAALRDLDGIEVYNARLARDEPNNADATALWDRLLTAGHRLWGLAGDDTLDSSGPQSTLGRTAVDVQVAEQTPVLIEAALKQGGFVDSTGVRVLGVADDNDTITVVTSDADEVKFIGKGGKVLQTSKGSRGDYHVRWDEGYIRAEATRKSDGAKAWTQPIFVNP